MTNTHCEICIGIDLGTTFSGVTLFRGRKKINMTFPRDGAQLPSAVYVDGSGGNLYGKAAVNAACRNPALLYWHFKRGMVSEPDDPWNGGPSPVELSGFLLKYIWDVICKVSPDVKDYVPELGGTRDSSLLKSDTGVPRDQVYSRVPLRSVTKLTSCSTVSNSA